MSKFFALVCGPEWEDIVYYGDEEAALNALRQTSNEGSFVACYEIVGSRKKYQLVKEYRMSQGVLSTSYHQTHHQSHLRPA